MEASRPRKARSSGMPAFVKLYIWRENTMRSVRSTLLLVNRVIPVAVAPVPDGVPGNLGAFGGFGAFGAFFVSVISIGVMLLPNKSAAAAFRLAAWSWPVTSVPEALLPLYIKFATPAAPATCHRCRRR